MQARTARPNDEVKKLISTNETLYQQLQEKTTTTKDATSKAKQLKSWIATLMVPASFLTWWLPKLTLFLINLVKVQKV